MAKNYTLAEAVRIINVGTDMEAIADIGRRFPTLLHKVTRITAKAGEDFVDLMNFMPDYLTANKVNSALKAAITEGAETESDNVESDETVETKDEVKEETTETAEWNESMSAKQLWDILGKAGKRKLAKSTKKADLVEACKQAFGESAKEEVEAEAPAEENPYEGKSAMELFKECKARGIKAAPKKPAKFYADLLVKADAETKEAEETESDEWEDEEPVKEEPKKAEKKATPKKAQKAKKEEAEDDDDWDI